MSRNYDARGNRDTLCFFSADDVERIVDIHDAWVIGGEGWVFHNGRHRRNAAAQGHLGGVSTEPEIRNPGTKYAFENAATRLAWEHVKERRIP